MSEGSEKFSIDPRRRRVNESFNWIGSELVQHAWQVVERVFEHLGVSETEKRDARVQELLAEMRSMSFRPSEAIESIALRQGKRRFDEQLERHADLALRQAVAVYNEFDQGRVPATRPPEGKIDSRLKRTFKQMQSSLLEAERHLTALDILKNLSDNHYSNRARKGGEARSRPQSKKEHETLLTAMIKGMLYEPSRPINIKNVDLGVLSREWAVKIYEFNRTFSVLRVSSRGDLEADIYSVLLSLAGAREEVCERERIHRMIPFWARKGASEIQDDEVDLMDKELAFERGFYEGIRRVIQYQIKNKFGDFTEEECEEISAISRPEDLQEMLDRLPEATSWEEVLGGRKIDS